MDHEKARKWSHEKISESLLSNARSLRKFQTPAEECLWSLLRNRKLEGFKFRRQQPMEGFILDFYCDEVKLGIELDGLVHSLKEQAEYDEQRTKFLEEFGIKIIRFTNAEVLENTKYVIKEILNEIRHRQ